MVESEK